MRPKRHFGFKKAVKIPILSSIPTLLFLISASALGLPCEDWLKESKGFDRLNKISLDAFQAQDDLSAEELLVRLKAEVWSFLPDGRIPWKDRPDVPAEFIRYAKETLSSTYRTEDMPEKDLYLFYANHLNSIYYQLLREWMENLVHDQARDLELDKESALKLMAYSYPSSSLFSPTLLPELFKEIIEQVSHPDFLRDLLQKEKDLGRLESKPTFPNPCCKTIPGCLLCPNNLNWIKSKN